MPITGNKRVTQLVQLTAGEISSDDLFLVIDSSAKESKKMTAADVASWLNASGSLYAYSAIFSDTASYVLSSNVDGIVDSASYAIISVSSLSASFASLAANSVSSSYALSASYALNGGTGTSTSASYLIYSANNGSASYAIKARNVDSASVTLFLSYTGGNNGTASYSMRTGNVSYADTASYVAGGPTATASYAHVSGITNTAITSETSSYLNFFGGDNGTASYAMVAKSSDVGIKNYGIFLANSQSTFIAQLDSVDVLSSTMVTSSTQIEAMGTVIIPFTSSIPTNGTIVLSLIDRNTGVETLLDSTPVSADMSDTVGAWGSYNSGIIKYPFSLMGQTSLYGSYLVFISSSNNIQIESSRIARFSISSISDTLNSYATESLQFVTTPISNVTFSFSMTGEYYDTSSLAELLDSGSSNILTLNAINQNISSMRYLWKLNNLTASNISNNPMTFLSGIPDSMLYLSCSNCLLGSLYDLSSSSLDVLNCSNNSLSSLPNLPISMSYLNCSNNYLTPSLNLPETLSYLDCSSNDSLISLSDPLPFGISTIFADSCSLYLTSSFPDTILSMSFNDNFSTFLPVNLPASLSYFSINNVPITSLPVIPLSMSYASFQSCSLDQTTMENITIYLLAWGATGGYLDLRGNGLVNSNTSINIWNLVNVQLWTVLYDV